MNTQFDNIAILGRHDDARVAEAMQVIAPYLAKAGIKVFAANEMRLDLPVTRMD